MSTRCPHPLCACAARSTAEGSTTLQMSAASFLSLLNLLKFELLLMHVSTHQSNRFTVSPVSYMANNDFKERTWWIRSLASKSSPVYASEAIFGLWGLTWSIDLPLSSVSAELWLNWTYKMTTWTLHAQFFQYVFKELKIYWCTERNLSTWKIVTISTSFPGCSWWTEKNKKKNSETCVNIVTSL